MEGIDYEEKFSPIARIEVVRLMLACASYKNFKVYQMDVKSTFLNGDLEEEVYIEKPDGFYLSDEGDMVCKLKKALYGLKQAPRAWYARLDTYLMKLGFCKGTVDSNLYFKVENDNILIVEVFMDDIIFGGDDDLSMKFVDDMQMEFEMSMIGEMKFFLGLQITQTNKGNFISKYKYVKELLKKFGLDDSEPIGTPMVTQCKLSKNDQSKKLNQTLYRSMVGGILYLTQNRLDIMHVVCLCAIFQVDLKETHVTIVKRIFTYLKKTIDYGLWYLENYDFMLCSYINVDWVGDVDDWKRTTRGSFFLGKKLVSWASKKHDAISLSTAEVEYIISATNCTQVVWMKYILKDNRVVYEEPIVIYSNNSSAISISKNPVLPSKMKHISIKYHFLWEKISDEEVKMEYVSTKDQIANIFTKPLPAYTFVHLRDKLGLFSPPNEKQVH